MLTPGWLAGHVGVVALCVAFVFLGRWQWNESQAPGGDLQNLAYAIQWWLFIGVALLWWRKVIKDQLSGGPAEPKRPTGLQRPAMSPAGTWFLDGAASGPTTAAATATDDETGRRPASPTPAPEPDPELDEWNRWLARLSQHPGR